MSKPTSIRAFAVSSAGGQVSEFLYEPMALGANEVEVEIECCGVCHSDVHQHHNDWGTAHYPMVLGHEIIGRVIAKGDLVDSLDIGARVGIGVCPPPSNPLDGLLTIFRSTDRLLRLVQGINLRNFFHQGFIINVLQECKQGGEQFCSKVDVSCVCLASHLHRICG